MAKPDKSIQTYTGNRVSKKQFKLFLAYAPTPTAKKAIKNLYLSEPVKVFAKNTDAAEAVPLETDIVS